MNLEQYIEIYLTETREISKQLDKQAIAEAVELLRQLKLQNGRLFILGSGGSAGNASHAVNDFRKIAKIETYAPSDNVSELTAWVNDVGWDVAYSAWLEESHLCGNDMLLVCS